MCPWRSRSTVQVMLSTTPAVPSGCETVNLYRVPVQPGPDTDPSLSTLAPDLSSASRACGLNGRSELKSHASCAPADPYGGSASCRGSSVQRLPPVSVLAWGGGSFVYAFWPIMRVRHPLDSISSPKFRFRSSLPVICSGDWRTGPWPGTVLCWVTIRFMRKLSAAARDSALVTAASAGGAAATVKIG